MSERARRQRRTRRGRTNHRCMRVGEERSALPASRQGFRRNFTPGDAQRIRKISAAEPHGRGRNHFVYYDEPLTPSPPKGATGWENVCRNRGKSKTNRGRDAKRRGE